VANCNLLLHSAAVNLARFIRRENRTRMKPLALFVFRITFADNIQHSIPANRAAMLAYFLHRASNTHWIFSVLQCTGRAGPGDITEFGPAEFTPSRLMMFKIILFKISGIQRALTARATQRFCCGRGSCSTRDPGRRRTHWHWQAAGRHWHSSCSDDHPGMAALAS
jgi:hypothetical protein